MKRHFYLSDDLSDLEALEQELEDAGVDAEQIHILSNDEAELENRHLRAVGSFSKKDIVRAGSVGFAVGILLVAVMMLVSLQLGLDKTDAWMPIMFLAVVTLGFCTWEGGLWGIQNLNHEFKRFHQELDKGKHLFFVDVKDKQESVVSHIVDFHPKLVLAGSGGSSPEWLVNSQKAWHRFVRWAP